MVLIDRNHLRSEYGIQGKSTIESEVFQFEFTWYDDGYKYHFLKFQRSAFSEDGFWNKCRNNQCDIGLQIKSSYIDFFPVVSVSHVHDWDKPAWKWCILDSWCFELMHLVVVLLDERWWHLFNPLEETNTTMVSCQSSDKTIPWSWPWKNQSHSKEKWRWRQNRRNLSKSTRLRLQRNVQKCKDIIQH